MNHVILELESFLLKIFIKHAALNTGVILIFLAGVAIEVTVNGVIKNLANFNVRIDPDRLCAEHF